MLRQTLLLLWLSLTIGTLQAQDPQSRPPGLRTDLITDQGKELPALDRKEIERQDARFPGTRFAASTDVNYDLANSGSWTTLDNGDRVWQLRLRSRDQLALAAFFDEFFLPKGSQLYAYTPDTSRILGPYTADNNPPNNRFLMGFLPGSEMILEYYEPAPVSDQGKLHIFRVDQAYAAERLSDFGLRSGNGNEFGFGSSSDCTDNANCNAGADFDVEKSAVVRILLVVEEGSGYCTGTLVNNTAQDSRPLVLSAFHCQDGLQPVYDFYRFDFNYETKSCSNPDFEPGFQSILGCRLLAGREENDFNLMELSSPIPKNYNAHFLGWDRSEGGTDGATIIHHPRGDVKKISFDKDPVTIFNRSINWNNQVTTPPNHHFRAVYDEGTFEIGSSGSALLNTERRIIGQLHGGTAACDTAVAYFGRLALAWDGGGDPASRLRDWLDPLNSGTMTLDAIPNDPPAGIRIAGMLLTETGLAIPGARVVLVGDNGTALSTFSDADGLYSIESVTPGASYEVSVSKPDVALLGVSTFDLVKLQQHILNVSLLNSPYKILAGDVNNNGDISTLDLILIRKVILGIDAAFEAVASWRFLPVTAAFNDPANPFAGVQGNPYQIVAPEQDVEDFDLIGIKSGDVNSSVQPE